MGTLPKLLKYASRSIRQKSEHKILYGKKKNRNNHRRTNERYKPPEAIKRTKNERNSQNV